MKTRNSNGFNRKTKVCVMIGFYDNEGEYCERLKEDIELRELPEKVIERVNFRYDITTLYSNAHVLVIAKTKQKIEDYKTQMATYIES